MGNTQNRERMPVGEAIQFRRKLLGLNQSDIARQLGVSQNTVSRWEVAARPPRNLVHIEKLAALLHVDPNDLSQGIIPNDVGSGIVPDVEDYLARTAACTARSPYHYTLLLEALRLVTRTSAEGLRQGTGYLRYLAEHYPTQEQEQEEG